MSWWEGLKIDAIRVARQLWEQTHPNEGKAAPALTASEATAQSE